MQGVVPNRSKETPPGDDIPEQMDEKCSPIKAMAAVVISIVVSIAVGAGIWLAVTRSDSDSSSSLDDSFVIYIKKSNEIEVEPNLLPTNTCLTFCSLSCNTTSLCMWNCNVQNGTTKQFSYYNFSDLLTGTVPEYFHCGCAVDDSWTCFVSSNKNSTLSSESTHLVPNNDVQSNCNSSCVLLGSERSSSGLLFTRNWFCEENSLLLNITNNSTEETQFNETISVGDVSVCENVL